MIMRVARRCLLDEILLMRESRAALCFSGIGQGEDRMGHRWMWLWLMAFSSLVLAGGPGAVRKQVESSMLVTGTVDVEPDGRVSAHALDQPDKLPPGVVELIGQAVPHWAFEPVVVDGHVIRARAKMTLRIVAKKLEDQGYSIAIRGATFGAAESEQGVSGKTMTPPTYPYAALSLGITGTVYVVLRIARDGHVQEAVAEQVNLRIVAGDREMALWRNLFTRSALSAAKRWSFVAPTTGRSVDDEFWSVRVPIDYRFDGQQAPKYGQWETYVPGPRTAAPWVHHDDVAAGGADALVAGTVSQIGKGLRLLTPLQSG